MTKSTTYSLAMGTEVCCRILEIDPDALLRAAGLDGLKEHGKDIKVNAVQFFHAWDTLTTLVKREDYLVYLGVNIARGPVILVFFALSCAPNLDTGLTRLTHFKSLLGPTRMQVYRESNTLRVEYDSAEASLEIPVGLAALHLIYCVEAARLATASHVSPVSASLKASEKLRRQIAGHLGVMPAHAEATSVTFSLEDARLPFISENPRLWEDFEVDLKEQLKAQRESSTFTAQVKVALTDLLATGRANAENVCFALAVSRSTLQRSLRAQGTSFQSLLDSTRRELAIRYLTKSTLRVKEIASMVGYRDANSFSRRFKKWTGVAPEDYRRMH